MVESRGEFDGDGLGLAVALRTRIEAARARVRDEGAGMDAQLIYGGSAWGARQKCEEFGRGGGEFHREVSGSSTSWRWRTALTSGPEVAVTQGA